MNRLLPGLLLVFHVGCAAAAADGERTIDWAGQKRRYLLHVPEGLPPGPHPLVLILHGGGSRGDGPEAIRRYTHFNALADDEFFLVAYPAALHSNWNDGREANNLPEQADNVDDVGFLRALVDDVIAHDSADSHRIYVAGISNGSLMSHRLACEASDRFAAVGSIAGTMAEALFSKCAPAQPVPMLMMHGTKDSFIPIDGGEVTVPWTGQKRGRVHNVRGTFDFWASHNGCSGSPQTSSVNARPLDNTSVEKIEFAPSSCSTGADTRYFIIHDGGHTWPGANPVPFLGRTSREIDASKVLWEFFKSHTR